MPPKKLPVVNTPPQPAAEPDWDNVPVRIPVPTRLPVAIRVPSLYKAGLMQQLQQEAFKPRPPGEPPPQQAPQQTTAIAYSADGTLVVRPAWMYLSGATERYGAWAETTTSVFCTAKLGFTIAITACPQYCRRPCMQHMEALQQHGWVQAKPPLDRAARSAKPDDDEKE